MVELAKELNKEGSNRFRFQSFRDRVKELKINVAHRVVKQLQEPGVDTEAIHMQGSYWGEALAKWKELNCTAHFSAFYGDVADKSRSLTQLLHHKHDIFDILVSHLKIKDSLALEPILNLVIMFARDLQDEFYPFYSTILDCIVALLPNADSDRLEWIYNSIAYLFKYLSPQLIQDPLPTFKVLQPQLADKRHYIRSFSAEAYAFLLRKVKLSDLMRIFSDIVDDLRRVGSTDYCDGICVLFFEVCKQVKGTLHSRAKQSLAILCEIILVDVKHDQLDIAYLMLQKLGILLGNHTETQHFEPVWELTYEIIDKVSTIFIQTTITDNSPNLLLEQECLRFGKSVRFFANLVAGQKGERITDRKKIFKCMETVTTSALHHSSSSLTSTSIFKFCMEQVVRLIAAALETSSLEMSLVYGKKTLDALFNSKFVEDTIALCEILRMRNWTYYPKLIMPKILSFVQKNYVKHDQLLLAFLASIFVGGDVAEMLTSVPSHLKTSGNLLKLKIDLGSGKDTELLAARILTSISAKRQWISELDSLERFPSLSLIPSDCATTKPCAISLVSAGISCLSFLEIQFEPLLESVEQLLRNLLECIHSASVTAMSQEFQGPHVKGRRSYVLVSLIAHTLRSITSRALRCGLTKDLGCLWQIVMYDFLTLCDGNAAALSGVADYCEALSSESSFQSKFKDQSCMENIFGLVEFSIGSYDHFTRFHALRIINSFQPLAMVVSGNKETSFSGPCKLLSHCLEMERMTDSLQSFRDKTIVLRRIETLQLSRCLPDLYASVGIRYMLALLSSNFNPLSEEALKTLSKLGEMDPKRFWVAFERALTSVCKSSSPGQDDKCSLELDAKNQLVYVDMDEDMSLFESASASIIPVSTKKIQGRSSAANNSGSSAAKLVHSNVSFEDIAIFKLSERFISAYSMANNVVKWTCKKFVEACALEKTTVDISRYFLLLIRTLGGVTVIIDQKSSIIVPLFTNLFVERIESGDIEVSQDIKTRFLSMVGSSSTVTSSMKNTEASIKAQTLEFLDMFAKFKRPERLHNTEVLKAIYMSLLCNGDSTMQTKACECILTYKNPALVAHTEKLNHLLDDESFRDALSTIDIEEMKSMNALHRPEFMKVLSRILYGKIVSRKGRGSSKAGIKARRTAIFSFLASLDAEDHTYILDLMIQPFEKVFGAAAASADGEFALFLSSSVASECDVSSLLPSGKQQLGFLNVFEDFLKQFQSLVLPFAPRIISTLLHLLECTEDSILKRSKLDMMDVDKASAAFDRGEQVVKDGVDYDDIDENEEDAAAAEDLVLEHHSLLLPVSQLRNVRQLILKRIRQLFEVDLEFDFTPYMPVFFETYISPRLVNFAVENTQAPSALLEMFVSWSRNAKYVMYLVDFNERLIPQLFNVLSAPKVRETVVSKVLDVIEAVIEHHQDTSEEKGEDTASTILSRIIISNIDLLLKNINNVLQNETNGADGNRLRFNKIDAIPNRIVFILSKVSPHVKNSDQANLLIDMMLPFLKKSTKIVSEVSKAEILHILAEFTPILPGLVDAEHGVRRSRHFHVVSQLFSTLESRKARAELVYVFQRFFELDSSLKHVFELVSNLNAVSTKRLDQPDFDRMFASLKIISSEAVDMFSPQHWLPILHNLLHHIKDPEEYSIRSASGNGIKKLIDLAAACASSSFAATGTESSLLELVQYTVFPGIRRGLKIRTEIIRHEFVSVLNHLVSSLPLDTHWKDMVVLLGSGNEEANFFLNIYHLQAHRRTRALKKLFEDSVSIAPGNLSNILCPIVAHFIFESDRVQEHQLVNEAINTLSKCVGLLSWSQYHSFIKRYMESINRHPYLEKVLVRVVVAVLDQFNFPMAIDGKLTASTSEDKESAPATVVVDSGEEEVERVVQGIEEDDEEEEEVEEEKVDAGCMHLNSTTTLLAIKIHGIVVGKIIPKLFAYLSTTEDDSLLIRVPVALSITKLLKKLPVESLKQELPKLIITLCNILKSKQQSARDTTREILIKVAIMLGMEYVPFIIKELKSALVRGYQLHILGYTINALLNGIVPEIQGNSPELDFASSMLVEIFVSDIFSTIGDEREVEELKGKMKEIKKTKSFESFEVLSRVIKMSSVGTLLLPMKEILLETNNTKVTCKVDEVLKRITAGLAVNSGVEVQDLLVFVHELVTENLVLLKENIGKKVGMGGGGRKTLAEKNFEVQMKRPDTKNTIKYFESNSYRFVEFGFALMLIALRRERINLKDPSHLSLMDPFIMHLGKALYSKHDSVVITSVRILAIVVKSSLPSVADSQQVITKRLLQIISKCATTASDLIQSVFKLLTVLLRECKGVVLKEHQLTTLLTLMRPDLEETERQSVTFSLIRAIVSRKIVVNEVYDVMEDISRIMVTNQSHQVRELCRLTYLQFLLDYPQGPKRLQNQWTYLLKNLQYEYESGRDSVMELLNLILDKFPESIVLEYSEVLFVALVYSLINDDSSKCRQMAGILIKKVLSVNGVDRADKLLQLVDKWFEQREEPQMVRTAAQVYGLVVEVFGEKAKRHVSKLNFQIESVLELVKQEVLDQQHRLGSNDSEENSASFSGEETGLVYWEAGYYSLSLYLKLLVHFGPHQLAAAASTETTTTTTTTLASSSSTTSMTSMDHRLEAMWGRIVNILVHPHQWLRNLSSRVLGQLFASVDPSTLNLIPPSSSSKSTSSSPASRLDILSKPGSLYRMALLQSKQLTGKYSTADSGKQVVKNMFFLAKCMYLNQVSDVLDEEEEEQEEKEEGVSDDEEALDNDMDDGGEDSEQQQQQQGHEHATHTSSSATTAIASSQTLIRMIKKMSYFSRASANQSNSHVMRVCIFQWFAAVSTFISKEHLCMYVQPMLASLYRVANEETAKGAQSDELKELATEVMDMIQKKMGTMDYLEVYNQVRSHVLQVRQGRRQKRAIEAISNPEQHAKRKIQKNVLKKERRKRKMSEMLTSYKKNNVSKRSKHGMND